MRGGGYASEGKEVQNYQLFRISYTKDGVRCNRASSQSIRATSWQLLVTAQQEDTDT